MKTEDREALRRWENYFASLMADVPVIHKNRKEMDEHRAYLEAHVLEWITFFFPEYAKYEFAPFHIKAIKRCIKNDEWFEVLSWARSLAKSTVVMFIVLYLVLTGRKHNIMMVSATQGAAVRLFDPYRKEQESNPRLRAYYGEQIGAKWTDEEFITKCDVAFRAIGYGNAPRGSRNKSYRPDMLLVDDFDTDEACRNAERIKDMWNFWEKAVYGTRDPAVPVTIIFCGNIIAKDCCVVRAGKMADHWDIVNIRDEKGNSTWPQKNTEEMIDETLGKISAASGQTEYFNNPVSEGEIFKELHWGKVPPLGRFKFLVVYGDPSPGQSKKGKSSYKAVWLIGEKDGIYYVIKGFLNRGLNSDFIDWYFFLDDFVRGKVSVYHYMENNSLQDPFFQQVFRPLLKAKCEEKGKRINIRPDEEKKTEKATRIEANLEPLNREGRLIFNQDEKENPDMVRLAEQFLLFNLQLTYPADGPDCIEGAKRIIDNKCLELQPMIRIPVKAFRSKNKYRL